MIKNIETKIKLSLIVSIGSFLTSIIIAISAIVFASGQVAEARKKIYVVDNGVPILVAQTGGMETREIEQKSHVELFHSLFFTLPPDDEYIKNNIQKAMYLIDESGMVEYNNLKEKGYYSSILGTSTTVTIKSDSIQFDGSKFTYYATQRLDRKTSILKRQLVTTGNLIQVQRSPNNPHGLMITGWKTIANNDLDYVQKRNL